MEHNEVQYLADDINADKAEPQELQEQLILARKEIEELKLQINWLERSYE
jgi:hypothetical protein